MEKYSTLWSEESFDMLRSIAETNASHPLGLVGLHSTMGCDSPINATTLILCGFLKLAKDSGVIKLSLQLLVLLSVCSQVLM